MMHENPFSRDFGKIVALPNPGGGDAADGHRFNYLFAANESSSSSIKGKGELKADGSLELQWEEEEKEAGDDAGSSLLDRAIHRYDDVYIDISLVDPLIEIVVRTSKDKEAPVSRCLMMPVCH